MSEIKIQGPIEVEIKVGVTNGEGVEGFATYSVCKGYYPSEQEMRDAVRSVEAEVKGQGLRLMNKSEWWNHVIPPSVDMDEDGNLIRVPFAVHGGKEWDA